MELSSAEASGLIITHAGLNGLVHILDGTVNAGLNGLVHILEGTVNAGLNGLVRILEVIIDRGIGRHLVRHDVKGKKSNFSNFKRSMGKSKRAERV